MRLRQRLITGLVTLLPLIVTLYLLGWVYTYSGAYIQAFLRLFGLEVPRAYQPLLPFVGLFLAAVLVYLVGTLAENYLGKRLIVSLERSLLLLPIVRDIYKAVQQIAHTLFGHQEVKFSRAAVIEYPRRGVYALCFVVQSVGGGFPLARGLHRRPRAHKPGARKRHGGPGPLGGGPPPGDQRGGGPQVRGLRGLPPPGKTPRPLNLPPTKGGAAVLE